MEITIKQTQQYPLTIGSNIALDQLLVLTADKTYFIAIDKRVHHFYAEKLSPLLLGAADTLIIESEEYYKNQETIDAIHTMLNTNRATRSSLILAIGGGIVGDIVGFAAGTYMRGIPFIQVPTTLLSQVDSSIGSKVAINAFGAKNNIGMFYSPSAVIIDLAFLETLTTRIFKEGLVELMKHGFIADVSIIELLEKNLNTQALRMNPLLLEKLIRQSLEVKKSFVEQDFFDTGLRHMLNFGHTFAHALEMSSKTKLYHGECVAIGMLVSTQLSGDTMTFQRVKKVLEQYDCLRQLEDADLTKMIHDKKRTDTIINEITLPVIGMPSIVPYTLADLSAQFEIIYAQLQADVSIHICTQQFVFEPVTLKGTITNPPSKSYAHRYLIAAALANTPTILTGITERSDDIAITEQALGALGCSTLYDPATSTITITPGAIDPRSIPSVHMGESGTSLRLLLPVLIAVKQKVHITGEHNLPARPLDTFFTNFTEVTFTKDAAPFNLPLQCEGQIVARTYEIPGNISSQFISGLLFTLPLLDKPSKIIMTSVLQSLPYVQMTLEVLADFGIIIEHTSDFSIFTIPGLQTYRSQGSYAIETDYSARGFFAVAQSFGKHKIEILPPVGKTTQGDALVLSCIANKTHHVNLMDIPDTAPILSILFSQSGGVMEHTDRLKYKESDRLAAISDFLTTMEISHTCSNDILNIEKGIIHGGVFDTYKDHRITMSLIIASTIAQSSFTLNEVKSSTKSYKNFIADYEKLGGFVDEK